MGTVGVPGREVILVHDRSTSSIYGRPASTKLKPVEAIDAPTVPTNEEGPQV